MSTPWRALVWLDKWVNDNLLRGRWETVSGRCYRRIAKGCPVCKWLCRRLDRVDPGHCRRAFFNDRAGNNPHNLPWV